MRKHIFIVFIIWTYGLFAQDFKDYNIDKNRNIPSYFVTYSIETSAFTSNGKFSPLWFSANRFGLSSTEKSSGFIRAGLTYEKKLKHNWKFNTGIDLAGGWNMTANFRLQQLFAEICWKNFKLGIGRKERYGFPLVKNYRLSSGMMVEGPNTLPVPQIRGELSEFTSIPGTKDWLAFKGHIAYGMFYENNWQKDFVRPGGLFTEDVLYHSKSLMLRLGNVKKIPVDFEFGILMATQFGGNQFRMNDDGSVTKILDMPSNGKAFWKAFFPQSGGSDTPEGEQVNMEGNHVGSWNFALNLYCGDWKIRGYLEHYFEDHSQMFWEYGRWKDGQIGIEISFPKNRWISSLVWEGLCTKDQSGPLLYDGFWGQFPEYQISANDDYYNHYIYGAWQYMGMGMGNPLIPGPLYNDEKGINFRSNRMKGQHLGIEGMPTEEWRYRVLLSLNRHWGTYKNPLESVKRQFSSMVEVQYFPKNLLGWNACLSVGFDRGNYTGNTTGIMISIKKTGCIGRIF